MTGTPQSISILTTAPGQGEQVSKRLRRQGTAEPSALLAAQAARQGDVPDRASGVADRGEPGGSAVFEFQRQAQLLSDAVERERVRLQDLRCAERITSVEYRRRILAA